MISNFKFWTFLIILFIKVNTCAWLYINRLHFKCSICIVVFTKSHLIYQCIYKVLINLSATTDFSLLCAEYISVAFFSSRDFICLL